jgi:hypothetical protein
MDRTRLRCERAAEVLPQRVFLNTGHTACVNSWLAQSVGRWAVSRRGTGDPESKTYSPRWGSRKSLLSRLKRAAGEDPKTVRSDVVSGHVLPDRSHAAQETSSGMPDPLTPRVDGSRFSRAEEARRPPFQSEARAGPARRRCAEPSGEDNDRIGRDE